MVEIEMSDKKIWDLMSDEEKFGLTQEMKERIESLEAELESYRVKNDDWWLSSLID